MADGGGGGKQLSDLPEVILHSIFTAVEETRTRNAMALVCRRWLEVDRATRSSLALRGNVRDLLLVPTCFQSVTHLDLSLLSPWGSSLLPVYHQHEDEDDELRHYGNQLIAHRLRQAFPAVTSLTVYARIPAVVAALGPQWPRLREVKLIRWHQRPNSEVGTELVPLLQHCSSLFSVDLSNFYCWTEDLPPALRACPRAAASLIRLDLLGLSSDQGFNSRELLAISAACPNLRHLRASCVFNPRLIGFVGEEALLGLAANCPRLSLLHLVDTSALSSSRAGGEENGGVPPEDSRISHRALEELFAGLPLLEDLALEVYPGVCDAGPVLETLNSRCPRMEALRLGQFQGICRATGLHLDGIAVCGRLRRLAVKNAGDLTDAGLVAIGRGCSRLAELEIEGCQEVTEAGIRRLVSNRRGTLVEVRIAGCRRLTAARSLWSVEPIRDRVESLHLDCVWDAAAPGSETSPADPPPEEEELEADLEYRVKKRRGDSAPELAGPEEEGGEGGFWCRTWSRLRRLSLWVPVGEVLDPLVEAGLESCPQLEEICIKVEGDCRRCAKPNQGRFFGLDSLSRYTRLRKMKLDCGEAQGYALTAPMGQIDLSLWERFYLWRIGELEGLQELDYWPPQDKDMNQRGVSLPAAGQLAQCTALRKLFIHGTAHEHFMNFLLKLPTIRDVQLREDYYPAPEGDASTEMRVDSTSRFEAALNRRIIPD
ncbi:unnamed protein product [Spirodela intermedia]|uniref:Uncharacterized protein n=1 Tax=Spirodela intermedia TaxID=51605 RepID=A0A7I8LFX3_SPIIN|nr:unnamed protein product [Spirodela intermedia]